MLEISSYEQNSLIVIILSTTAIFVKSIMCSTCPTCPDTGEYIAASYILDSILLHNSSKPIQIKMELLSPGAVREYYVLNVLPQSFAVTTEGDDDLMLENATFIFPGPSPEPLTRCQPSIAIVDDSNLEGPEDFQVSVMEVSTPDGGVLNISMNSVTYTILDPEGKQVTNR